MLQPCAVRRTVTCITKLLCIPPAGRVNALSGRALMGQSCPGWRVSNYRTTQRSAKKSERHPGKPPHNRASNVNGSG